jgi:hypothetical protein
VTSTREIVIDPLTRLEGHGRVHMFLDEGGAVDRAYLQIPELRGFEKFAQGRRSEDMPQITSRICGGSPMAHHMASAKTLDAVYAVEPPPAARTIRELIYSAFMVEDHALHFFFLGGPDFIVGPDAAAAKRNILGVVDLVGLDIGKEVIGVRKQLRDFVAAVGGDVRRGRVGDRAGRGGVGPARPCHDQAHAVMGGGGRNRSQTSHPLTQIRSGTGHSSSCLGKGAPRPALRHPLSATRPLQ